MFKLNLLLTLRSFWRFKTTFFINLIGLATGLSCVLLIYLWVADELKVDQFHENDSRLYQVMEHQQYAKELLTTTSTPGVLAEALKTEIPEIEYAATTTWINSEQFSIDDHSVRAEGFYVGEDYFNIFSYEIIQGNPDKLLTDKTSIVISASLAQKLFNTTENVVGRQVDYQREKTFQVSGVFKDIPPNSSYQFEFVLPFQLFMDENEWVKEWGNNSPKTYVTVGEGTDVAQLNEKIVDFVKGKNEESNVSLFLQSYSSRYLKGRYENGVQSGGRIEYVQLFSIVAIFILLIATINFMNLSTAKATRRMKEIGVKKALGVKKRTLILQYLGESVMMSLLSLVVALVLVALVLPVFNEITDKQIALSFELWFIGSLLSIGVITGLVSGSYPALYLSGFAPVRILKGEVKGSLGELWARRGLVIAQFFLSIVLITAVVVIYQQIEFVQSKNLGFNKDNIVYFPIEGQVGKSTEAFLNELREVPGIVAASSVGHSFIGQNNNTSGLDWEGKNPEDLILFENMRVNHDLIETMGIEIVEGRSFSRDFSTDTAKIIFNEAAIKVMGLENPIGKVIKLWGEYDLEIIGVAKDFHFQSLHQQVEPVFFMLRPQSTWNVMARIEAGTEKATLETLSAFYKKFNPGFALNYQFLDESYQKQYAAEQRVATLARYFAIFAIIISCLGLFGLAAFTAERRQKEIGIRKVLGSSTINIVYLLSADFTKMVGVAVIFALPISYLLMKNWLDRFAYRIDLEIWFFALAAVLAFLIAWATVGSQAFKAARLNPTKCLRND